jgi:ABC-type glycerol-3-phosphate transport system permease component
MKPRTGASPAARLLTVLGLLILAAVNLGPLGLIVRQSLSSAAESARWPLPLLPGSWTIENVRTLWTTEALGLHVGLSVLVAVAATIGSLLLGAPAGWAAARLRAAEVLATRASLLTRILPPIAIAIPLTAILIPAGLYNHPLGIGLIAAHMTIGLPIVVLITYTAFRDLPSELEDAALVDGCSPAMTFIRIAVPNIRGALASASILVFLTSWDEFTYAILLQLTHRTMPPLIYYYTEYGQLGAASTLAFMTLVPAVIVIAALQRLLVRGVLAGGLR